MRKSLFLLAIFVCLLGSASAQSEINNDANDGMSLEGSLAIGPSTSDISGRISEARRLLSSRTTSAAAADVVTLAAFDPETLKTRIFSLPKDEFLKKDAEMFATSEPGRALRVHVVRANGVNTAVTI